jgi:hypothetical protein
VFVKDPNRFMEETDMCHPIPAAVVQQTQCAAKTMGAQQRQDLAVQALAGNQPISKLAEQHDVSRKFIYQQAGKAQEALDDVFDKSAADDDKVLFHLPVTKAWLRQLILALVLLCHAPIRGIHELLRDLLGTHVSLGTIHNVVQEAVARARPYNDQQDLSRVRIGAHDEIFQGRRPVLVGADADSTYCYLLSLEEQRDGETWGLRLLELQDRGLAPEAIIGDGGSGLCKGQDLAMPEVSRRGDVFHPVRDVETLVNFLDNRAYDAIAARTKLEHQQAQAERTKGRRDPARSQKLRQARPVEAQAIQLADDIALLARWLRTDVLSVAGPSYADRCALYDFIVAELQAREPLCPHRLKPVRTMLQNQRDALLAFAQQLDHDLAELAQEFAVSVDLVRDLLRMHAMPPLHSARWQREAKLRDQLRGRFYALSEAVEELAAMVVRASSLVENINGRLRCYFYLRRHLGSDYLTLLRFFFNHRRFQRSRHPERVGKSPAELLTGQEHPHWLEMLGYQLFCPN